MQWRFPCRKYELSKSPVSEKSTLVEMLYGVFEKKDDGKCIYVTCSDYVDLWVTLKIQWTLFI